MYSMVQIVPRPEEDTNKEINLDAPVRPGLNPDNIVKLNF